MSAIYSVFHFSTKSYIPKPDRLTNIMTFVQLQCNIYYIGI